MNFDNIYIDLTALYCMLGAITGLIIAPFDAFLIKRHIPLGKIYHSVKFILLYVIAYIFVSNVFPPEPWYISLARIIAGGLVYSVYFDTFLNVLRGKDLFYIGKTAELDKLARKWLKSGLNYIFLRLFLVIVIGMLLLLWK